jgi:rod shape determining protein RodA
MINFRLLKQSDYAIFICVGLLLIIGILMILSATFSMQTRAGEDPFYFAKRHIFAIVVGLIVMFGLMYMDVNNLKAAAIPLYVFVLIILGLVFLRGFTVLGAQRWISLGPISFQPSEIAKLVSIIVLSFYLESRIGKITNLISLVPVMALIGVPFLLIFRQPDLGTALVVLAISFGMLVWAKSSVALLLALFSPLISIVLFPHFIFWIIYLVALAITFFSVKLKLLDSAVIFAMNVLAGYLFPIAFGMLKGYQRQRILAFLNPNIDPRGAGYHSLQAKVAVGSGGFFGRGPFHGTQTQLQFIPQQFSDFIYSAVGEELGFLGALFVLSLFVIIIWRAIKIATESRTAFGSLLASGIAVMYIFHLLVNVGMTLGMLPVVGIPLPLMSFGGTSLLMNLAAIGILQSISMRRKKLIF